MAAAAKRRAAALPPGPPKEELLRLLESKLGLRVGEDGAVEGGEKEVRGCGCGFAWQGGREVECGCWAVGREGKK